VIRNKTALETAIICVAAVIAPGIVGASFDNDKGNGGGLVTIVFFGVIGLCVTLTYRYLTARKRVQVEIFAVPALAGHCFWRPSRRMS
jgi:hypothetical protein